MSPFHASPPPPSFQFAPGSQRPVLVILGSSKSVSPNIDEKSVGLDFRNIADAHSLTLQIAHAKAAAVLPDLKIKYAKEIGSSSPLPILISCDQVIVCNGEIREKPESADVCRKYMKSYESYPAECVCGIVVTNVITGYQISRVERAKQYWNPVPEEVLNQAIQKGDILECAGGFMIDEPLLHPYVGKTEGTTDGVMGMPLHAVKEMVELVVHNSVI